MMAERARYFKSSVAIDPMPAFERRIVHEFLSEASDLKTESEGVGPHRRVIIKYVGDKDLL
jgi:spoIIIJ-associated protein